MDELVRRLLCLPPRGSTFAAPVDHLHYAIIGTTLLGAALVAAFTLLCLARGARGERGPARTPRVRAPLLLELGGVGALLSLFVLWWALGFRIYLGMGAAPPDAATVYVVAKQWVWQFDAPGGPASVDELVVPARRPVRLLLTSRDVIHSFFVPAFRLKADAVPGRFTAAWFEAPEPGTFEVLCAEFCGASHSRMRARVVALEPEEYARWASSGGTLGRGSDLAARGREVAARKGCLQCHTTDGARHLGPTWKDLLGTEEALATGERVLVDEAYVTESMMEPERRMVAGFPPIMPSYRGQVDPAEAAALIEYMRSLSRGGGRGLSRAPRSGADDPRAARGGGGDGGDGGR